MPQRQRKQRKKKPRSIEVKTTTTRVVGPATKSKAELTEKHYYSSAVNENETDNKTGVRCQNR